MFDKPWVTLSCVLLAGCGRSLPGELAPPVQDSAAAVPGCHSEWPVMAHHADGEAVQLPAKARLPLSCAYETGHATSESTLAISGNGTLIYSPAQTENTMTRSLDDGRSWHFTYPASEQLTSLWNTFDPYLIADRRTGRVFWAHATGPARDVGLLPDSAALLLAAAYGFELFTSSDDGQSWTTADYSTAPMGDWEQVFVGPPPPVMSGAAQPVGYPNIVYVCANSPVEVSGPGRLCYKSLDGGLSFMIAGFVSPTAANPADICAPLNFNNGVVDSAGTIYIPVSCSLSSYIVISGDEGASWKWTALPDAPPGDVIPGGGSGKLQIAVDDADMLYALWTANDRLVMEISRDHAASWSTAIAISAPGVTQIQRATFSAGAPGHVAATYYGSTDPDAVMLSAYLTQTASALDEQPLFYSGVLNDPAAPIFHDGGLTGGSPRADYIGGAYDSAGTTYWAGLVKQFGAADADNRIATTGYVGRLLWQGSTPVRLP